MFGIIGKVLSAPVRIVAVPLDVAEKCVDTMVGVDTPREDRFLSGPLHSLADSIEVDG